MTAACQDSSTGGPATVPPAAPGIPSRSSQSATRWAMPPLSTPPRAQARSATTGPASPLSSPGPPPARCIRWETVPRTASSSIWSSASQAKASPTGSLPVEIQPGRCQQAYRAAVRSAAAVPPSIARASRGSSASSGACSLRPIPQVTATTATVSPARLPVSSHPREAATGPPCGAMSYWSGGTTSATATVSSPAAVCAARSRATSRRPYQKPRRDSGVTSAVMRQGLGRRRERQRALGLVRVPGVPGEPPEQQCEADRQRGARGDATPRLTAREEAQPALPSHAGRVARTLPGDQIHRDLAGGGHEQHGEREGEQPHQHVVGPVRPAAVDRRAHPVREIGHHEGEQQQPQSATAVP